MHELLSVAFTLTLLGGAAAAIRLSFNREDRAFGFHPEELLAGYAFTALLCRLSLSAFGTSDPGALAAIALAITALVRLARSGWRPRPPRCTRQGLVIAAFILALALIYAPVLFEGGALMHFPEIFDFPKHVSAVVAAAHAGRVIPNPYFPAGEFAYNTFFYLPLGVIARHAGIARFAAPVMAVATLWTVGMLVALIPRIFAALGIPALAAIGLLLATFVGNCKPVHVPAWTAHYPALEQALQRVVPSPFAAEDPLVLSAFVPQHLFAVALLLMLLLPPERKTATLRDGILLFSLSSAALLSSLILAPVILAAGAFAGYGWWRRLPAARRAPATLLPLLFFALAVATLLGARTWAGAEQLPRWNGPGPGNWRHYLLFAWGLFFPLAGLGLWRLRQTGLTANWRQLLLPSGVALLFLLFIQYPDSNRKFMMFLQYAMIPPAALGFSALREWLRGKAGKIGPALAWLLLLPGALITGVNFIHLAASAWRPRDAPERALILAARALPPAERILLLRCDQELAALTGHLSDMDFSCIRPDRYLPAAQRAAAGDFFAATGKFPAQPLPAAVLAAVNAVIADDPERRSALERQLGPPRFTAGDFSLFIVPHPAPGADNRPAKSSP